ncbi:BON domain-containing protein [Sulfitobacter sp. BDSS02]|nr:BON domain-containing protein [Sulfitobacter sp. BDSS02]MBR9850932.1 BON domain-containing protein [Paracoccaceae bacterium]
MARHKDDLTEEEARQAMSRRHQPDDRSPGERSSWLDRFGYGPAPMFGGYGLPFLPPAYGDELYGYGPYRRPGPMRRRGAPQGDDGERDFMDRAGDEIASWFGDDEAEARREADHRGRGPKGYVRSDARIQEDIHDRLTDDRFVDAREITVSVKDREITLDGTVESRRAKRRAEDCADRISGVTHVQNNLRVRPTE